MEDNPKPVIGEVAKRGFLGRCPNCGEGVLFNTYLKQVNQCSVCGEDYTDIQADDGPAWFTILLIGPFLVPIAFVMIMAAPLPTWLTIIILLALCVISTLLLLPRVKGVFIGIVWANRDRE